MSSVFPLLLFSSAGQETGGQGGGIFLGDKTTLLLLQDNKFNVTRGLSNNYADGRGGNLYVKSFLVLPFPGSYPSAGRARGKRTSIGWPIGRDVYVHEAAPAPMISCPKGRFYDNTITPREQIDLINTNPIGLGVCQAW